MGGGFLLPGGRVCTCAHVILRVLGLPDAATGPPTVPLAADFPFRGAAEVEAEVVEWSPVEALDVAILEIRGDPPAGARPADLHRGGRIGGRRLKTFGFPEGHPGGVWSKGNELGDPLPNGMVQFEATKTEGHRVAPGFSGAPVWDEETGEAVGMVVVSDRDPATKVAFLTPIGVLARLAPDLAGAASIAPFAHLTDGLSGLAGGPLAGIEDFLATYLGRPGVRVPFGGRDRELADLDAWLDDGAGYECALLVAEAGRGKSALLTKWADGVARSGRADVAFVPISIRFRTGRRATALSALGARLAHLLGIDTPPVRSPEDWIPQIDNYLRRDRTGRKLLVAIDGADEGIDWDFDLRLPAALGRGVKVIISARRLAERDISGWAAHLGWTGRCKPVELGVLDREGLRRVLESMGDPLASLATKVDVVEELLRLTRGDPLLVRLYVEALVGSGERTAFLAPDDLPSLGDGLEALMDRWWDDLREQWRERGVERGEAVAVVRDVLAHALGPLRWTELDKLCERDELDRDAIEEAVESLNRFVVGNGREQGFVFSHPLLAEFFRERRRSDAGWEARFVELGRSTLAGLDDGTIAPEEASPYALQYFDEHLERAGAPADDFRALVSDGWRRAWFALSGTHEGFLDDVSRAWALEERYCADEAERPSAVARQLRCALIHASVHSLAAKLPPDLIELLLQERLWTAELAIAHARRVSDGSARARTLKAIAPHLPLRLVPEAIALSHEVEGLYRIDCTAALTARVWREDPAMGAALMEAADDDFRASTLRELVDTLVREDGLDSALTAARTVGPQQRLAWCYPTILSAGGDADRVEEAVLTDAAEIADPADRLLALSVYAHESNAMEAWLRPAGEALDELTPPGLPGGELRALLHSVPETDRAAVIHDVVGAAKEADADAYPRILERWRGVVRDVEAGAPLMDAAVRAARRANDERGPEGAQELVAILRRTPPTYRPVAAERALEQLEQEGRGEFRRIAFEECLINLPEQALERALLVPFRDSFDAAGAVKLVAERLPASKMELALEAALRISDWNRWSTLAELVPYLPDDLIPRARERLMAEKRLDDGDHSIVAAEVALLLRTDPAAAVARFVESSSEWVDTEAARSLASRLFDLGVPEHAVEFAAALAPGSARVEVLTVAAVRSGADDRRTLARAAVEAAETVGDDGTVLQRLSPYLSHVSDACGDRLLDALERTDVIQREPRVAALVVAALAARRPARVRSLGSELPFREHGMVLAELTAAGDPGAADDLRALLLEKATPLERVAVIAAAAKSAPAGQNDEFRQDLATQLADLPPAQWSNVGEQVIEALPEAERPRLVERLLAAAREAAGEIPSEAFRMFVTALPWLPLEKREEVVAEAFACAIRDDSEVSRAVGVGELAAGLPPDLLSRALHVEFADLSWRAALFANVAPYLSDEQLDEAFEIKAGFDDEYAEDRASVELLGQAARRGRCTWALEQLGESHGRVRDAVAAMAPALGLTDLRRAWDLLGEREHEQPSPELVHRALELGALDLAAEWADAIATKSLDGGRVRMLAAVASQVDPREQWTKRAVEGAGSLTYDRSTGIDAVLPLIIESPSPFRCALFSSLLHQLARHTRVDLLTDLGRLMPLVLELGGTTAADGLVDAVIEVRDWFP